MGTTQSASNTPEEKGSTSAPSVRTTPKSEHIQTDTNNSGADGPNPSEKHNRSTEAVRTWVPKSQYKRQKNKKKQLVQCLIIQI